ncbi:MAG: hypothetical protein IJ452_02005 [Butyricicoccus sp.]|nr:hypothetical protein [Butyricicoccus sp.]
MDKIVVIGVGFIGGYLEKGFRALLGEDLRGHVFGIKGSTAGLAKKQTELLFAVSAGDTAAVLARENPDIIVLSPPPSVVPAMTSEILKPHYDACRAAGRPLPDLYTFAPTPNTDYFRAVLGTDVHIAKILPNIVAQTGGVDLSPIGMNYISIDPRDQWPQERLERLLTVLRPYGECVVLTDRDSLVLLSGKITSHCCYEVCFTIADVMAQRGTPVTIAALGSALRAAHRDFCEPPLPDLYPCGMDGLSAPLADFMRRLTRAWFDGLHDFSRGSDLTIPEADALRVDHSSFALNVFPLQFETREGLAQNTKNAATKGGVLERGIEYYHEAIADRLAAALRAHLDGTAEDDFFDWLRIQSCALSREAFARSCELTNH